MLGVKIMEQYLAKILRTLPKGSWCSEFKAIRMAELIVEHKPQVCVEIGVFGGDTLFVMAQALKHVGSGMVYGIDPWSHDDAIEGMDPKGVNFPWWSGKEGGLSLENVYRSAKVKRVGMMLEKQCELIRTRADNDETLARFADVSIGFFHFDGNHGQQAVEDARLWLPKLAPGCILFHDDVNWTEGGQKHNADAFEYFLDHGFSTLEEMIGDCAILRKN